MFPPTEASFTMEIEESMFFQGFGIYNEGNLC